jgi:hypothetical protein
MKMMQRKSPISLLILTVYFIVLCAVAVYSYRRPEYNWDMLPYMAIVLSAEHQDIGRIKQETYRAAGEHIPDAFYRQLINPAHAYRREMYLNDTAFYEQLAFYVVKPLYTALVYLAYHAGFPLASATVLPSIFSWLAISILLLYWLNKYLSLAFAAGAALLVMLSAPLLSVARLSTPDALSAFLLLGAFYFILQKPRLPLMLFFVSAAILARPDNIIPCILLLVIPALAKSSPLKISLKGYIGIFFLLCGCFLIDSLRAGAFGFDILYYPTFSHSLNMTHEDAGIFSWMGYLRVLRADAVTGLYHSSVSLFGFMALLVLYRGRTAAPGRLTLQALLVLLCCVTALIRFMLVPDIADRFYIPYYLLIAVLLTVSFAEDTGMKYVQNQKNAQWKF